MDKMDIVSKLNCSLSKQYSYYAILNDDICAHILDLYLTMCCFPFFLQVFCLSMNSNLVEIGSESENAFVEGELKIIHNHSLYPTSLVVRGVSTVEFWITYSEMNIRNLHTVQLHSYILLLPIVDEASLSLLVSSNFNLTVELIFINLINELRLKHSNTNV